MQVATLAAATDATTGLIDMDAINTGHTASERQIHETMCADLRALVSTRPRGSHFPIAELREEMTRSNDGQLDQVEFLRAIQALAT
eukprot:CAMPEP_0119277940 /NCGR_PEP_ID=MMETSP1329-20130426/18188_1 /TAXON_ID=114041 /ORGANISM="Genus nov. species nov., Strain RCC1024" /LENGTH=85 /DNA_ID=CAMNT_0007278435 /DNA_START=1 /DNA_END=255 /DNA_ORIENTATION=-